MLFLTTRYSDNIYKLIVNSCAKHFFKKNKNYQILKINLIKKYDLKFFFFLFKKIITREIFDKNKIIKFNYNNVNFGRYLFSICYRDIRSYNNNFFLIWGIFKYIIVIAKYFYNAKRLLKENNFNAIYLDHCFYLNGIFFEFFLYNNKTIYTNNYPVDIIRINNPHKNKIKIEDVLRIPKNKKSLSKNQIENMKKIHHILYKSEKTFYNWMQEIQYNKLININYKNFNYIIYAHSFVDAQLAWGYDGFINMYEWLDFTIKELNRSNKLILVKAHPNFYLKNLEIYSWERKLFIKIINKYKNFNNIKFINQPINNYTLMKNLNSKCIAITHHGSVGLELLFNNFKVISSECNFYESKYKISNQWKNKDDYCRLLNLPWDKLMKHSYHDFVKLTYQMFSQGYLGKNFHLKILNRFLKKNNLINKSNYDLDLAKKKFNKIKNNFCLFNKINLKITNLSNNII